MTLDKTSRDLLTVNTEPLGTDTLIVRMVGEIDLSSAHILSAELGELAKRHLEDVVLDATKVTFMDSTGLHALVEGKRALHKSDTRIYLVPSSQVRRVLELVFPDPLFAHRLDSVEEAIAAIDGRPA